MAQIRSNSIWVGLIALPLAAPVAAQESVEEFYKGKSITIGVGASTGGGYDVDARVISRHIGRYVPGTPTVVVANVPGARGLTNVNRIYNNAPRDGTHMGVVQRGLITAPWLNPKGIRFDVTKFNWLFSSASEPGVAIAWHTAPQQNIADVKKAEMIVGGSGDSTILPQVFNFTTGTKFKIVSGYPGSADIILAMQRGETHGIAYYSWSNIAARNADWISKKQIRVLLQTGNKRHPDLPDVPTTSELALNADMRLVQDLWLAPLDTARPYAMPPEVPMERVEAVRKAFWQMIKDKGFLADAKKAGANVDPRSAEDINALIKRVSAAPQAVIEMARSAVKDGS